jgi:transcriptional regulator with XRE-family HTH domain
VFARQVRDTRERKKWTQSDLANRLESLGYPIDRSAIARIEMGKRDVSLDEALAFAVALGVPPGSLILPRSMDETISPTPAVSVASADAQLWWWGAEPLRSTLQEKWAKPPTKDWVASSDPAAKSPALVYSFGQRSEERIASERFYAEARTDVEELADRQLPGVRQVWRLAAELVRSAAHRNPEQARAASQPIVSQLRAHAQMLETVVAQAPPETQEPDS